MLNPDGIPAELKRLNQWVCWRLTDRDKDGNLLPKPTKVPFSPIHGFQAAVNKPSDWASFDAALNHAHNYSGIGFVLTKDDPFVFIDLDDPAGDEKVYAMQRSIYERIDSFTELSPSGKGVHILVKGSVPSGRKRGKFEVYDQLRFMTVTGNVINPKPILEKHAEANALWEHLGGPAAVVGMKDLDAEALHSDPKIIEMALNAANGDKFKTLLDGNWQDLYPSQSEADFAFIDIISFYTQNRKQITRIFQSSPLGQREKGKRTTLIDNMITRSFDNQIPPVDIEELKIHIDEALQAKAAAKDDESSLPEATPAELALYKTSPIYAFPPGIVGEIASFILQSSPRPVPEVALAAAIGFTAGVTGKAYNVSNTGLNQYMILLATTGIGKESGAGGISRLVTAVQTTVPAIHGFIGPAAISSAQALIKHLDRTSKCFVSIVGEFGLEMRKMAADNANANYIGLRKTLLDLYNKSGATDTMHSMIYSNRDQNTQTVFAPAFSIYGEATPESFYGAMDESSISDGLLPRFTLIEYTGPRLPRVKNPDTTVPDSLVKRLGDLAAHCAAMQQNNTVNHVQFTKEAEDFFDTYEKECDRQINSAHSNVTRELWNRASLRAMKLAALVAVGINPFDPIIDISCARWAEGLVTAGVTRMLSRFESGDTGVNAMGGVGASLETDQQAKLLDSIREFYNYTVLDLKKYQIHEGMFKDRIIPFAYFQRRAGNMSCFKKDRLGPTAALKRAIQTMIDTDLLREVGRMECQAKYGSRQRAFMVATAAILAR
jgi:hypothetical protein